jgi:hypothetical protein
VTAGAVIIALAVGVAWYVKMNDRAAIEHAAKPPAAPPVPPAPSKTEAAPQTQPSSPQPAPDKPPPSAAVMTPSFDVARIGQDGRAVIAGRAAPGAKIVLLDGGKEIARGVADARGEWVLLAQDPPLAPGQHELRVVQHVEGRAPVTSEQVVIAVVPDPQDKKTDTLVMISPPSGASTLVQPPSPAGTPKSSDLQLSTLDYDEQGHVTITGQASAGAAVRAYLDDKLAAEGATGSDGRWRLVPPDPIAPGKHTLRLDRIGTDGKPTARLEMSFERFVTTSAPGDTRRLSVVRGDNLWNIARAHYGEGLRYTVIFEANKGQIRDPDLIYPGQVFSLPKLN